MRIHPRYFNRFMVIVAVTGIIVIALASYFYVNRQEQRFLDRLDRSDPAEFAFVGLDGDTIRIPPDRNTVVLFWATWSDRSIEELNDLSDWWQDHPDFKVIAAFVKDAAEYARAYQRPEHDGFQIADGTEVYQDLRVPGVPSAILFGPDRMIAATQVGSAGSEHEPVWREHGGQSMPAEEPKPL